MKLSLLSTQDQWLQVQFQTEMKSDKRSRGYQRHDYSHPKADGVDGSYLSGTEQAPCSPHLTGKKMKGWRNVATCPRHQLARGRIWSFDQAPQGLSHAPLPSGSSRGIYEYAPHQSLSAKHLGFLRPDPCPPPPDCQSLFCTEGDRWVLTNEKWQHDYPVPLVISAVGRTKHVWLRAYSE